MAVNLVTVTGNLETLIGATPTAGRLWFKLNRPDWNDAGEIFAPEYVEAVAETDGSFTINLQSTADFENGATYSAILKYFDPTDGKPKEFTLSTFALPTGGPYQLGDLLALASGGGALLEFQFANRAALVAKVASGLVPIPGFTYLAGGLSYLGKAGATGISDLPGLVPAGVWTLWHFGVVGDGVVDDGAAIAEAFASGGKITDKRGGTYRINDRTITVPHPTEFEGLGESETVFVFTGMGGFAGKDGFNVTFTGTPPLHSTTRFSKCSVFADGAYGRSGIKTPTNPGGAGLTNYMTIRPKYEFEDMVLGSLTRTPSVSSNMFGVDGWKDCIVIGESADSVVRNVRFVQPFLPSVAQASWAGRDDCAGIYLDAGEADAGAGPIYHPSISHITAHGCGKVIRARGHVTVAKLHEVEGFGNGWGVYSSSPLFAPIGGGIDGFSEGIITDSNLNGIFGGIYLKSTDFLHIDGVRATWPNITGVDYAGSWFGLRVESGFRQIDASGLRGASFAADALATFKLVDLNGRFPGDTGAPGLADLSALYINAGAVAPAQWNEPIVLRNVREARIDPPKTRVSSPITTMISHETDHSSIPPKITMTGVLPYTFTASVAHGAGSAPRQFYWPKTNTGIFVFASASAAGSQTISPSGARKYRQGFSAGAGAYTYDYNVSNDGAVEGQEVEFFLSLPASTFPTIRILDEASTVRATIHGEATARNWLVLGTWISIGGVLSFRITFAGKSDA